MDLKEENILGDKIHGHWYYVSKGRAIRKFLGKDMITPKILDVGAGSGIFSKQLIDNNVCKEAVCIDTGYTSDREELYNGKPIKFLKSIDQSTYNLILMMDVLEHVPDDVALLKEYIPYMADNSKILITVPAFQFVWSGHDVFLEHYRRYTIKTLETAILNAGLVPLKSNYLFAIPFPFIALNRMIKNSLLNREKIRSKSELKIYPDCINNLLITANNIETETIFPLNKLFGLSILSICEKPQQ